MDLWYFCIFFVVITVLRNWILRAGWVLMTSYPSAPYICVMRKPNLGVYMSHYRIVGYYVSHN